MTNKNLTRRLERLEARLLPASEEQIHIVRFISQDGQVADTKEFKRAADRSLVKQKRRWWR